MRIPRRATVPVSAAALFSCLHPALPPPFFLANAAVELDPEPQLIVDAWAVVQRAFYDPNYNGVDWKAIRSDYVKRKYNSMKAARSAVSEMLALLGDRYTRYLTPSAYETLLARYENTKGTGGGIGVVLSEKSSASGLSTVMVVSVADGSPAAKAGLHVGDSIIGVDGRSLPKMATAEDAAALILGPLDEPLSLAFSRGGEELSVNLKRAPLSSGEVSSSLVLRSDGAGPVGVLTIPQFSDGASWSSSLNKALEAVAPKANTLLFDLRGNLGGHFPTGVAAARLFLPSDALIVSTRDRNGVSSPLSTIGAGIYYARVEPTRLVVLVDAGTASAAEVFAAALQENGVATVVSADASTFGKGQVQTIAKVSDGGAVVCTTARYVTPKGKDLNGVGVVPDVRVGGEPCARTPAGAVECWERSLKRTEAGVQEAVGAGTASGAAVPVWSGDKSGGA
jgi:carboxyl-terminal processing protease